MHKSITYFKFKQYKKIITIWLIYMINDSRSSVNPEEEEEEEVRRGG